MHGPYEPTEGHRFNPNKLLLDPYAKQLVGAARVGPGPVRLHARRADDDLSFDERDSAAFVPKCRVIDPAFTWGRERRPAGALGADDHLRGACAGFTKRHPAVPEDAARHLRRARRRTRSSNTSAALGVTAIELLPIHDFVDDSYLIEKGLRNYWGYNTIGFFAPASRATPPTRHASPSSRKWWRTCTMPGIEVILDVVYNHTAEGNELGPTLSFKGIDNASYYRLAPDKRYYINDTGTGNTVNLSNSRVLQMVTDSLRYWAQEMHIDGFRFDLATILAREPHGFEEDGRFLDACRQDPVLSR